MPAGWPISTVHRHPHRFRWRPGDAVYARVLPSENSRTRDIYITRYFCRRPFLQLEILWDAGISVRGEQGGPSGRNYQY